MELAQSYQLEHTLSFEFVKANEPLKEENSLVAMRGLDQWNLSQNPAEVVTELTAEMPVNVLGKATTTEGLLLFQQEVE